MTPRERVLTTLSRQKPDKAPKQVFFTPALMEVFKEKTKSLDPTEYFNMEMRYVGFKGTKRKINFSEYLSDSQEGIITAKEESGNLEYIIKKADGIIKKIKVNEWGIGYEPGSMYHFTKHIHPLRNMKTVDELNKYPFPDMYSEYRYENLKADANKVKTDGYFIIGNVGHIFEMAWYMRGMENLLMDFIDNQDFANAFLDKITDIQCFVSKKQAEADVDIIHLGDDVAMQHKMIMKPDTWRYWLKPRLAKVINSAKIIKPKVHIFYHSDGNIEDIIPDLIEVGVDVLNPVQPECMDPVQLKKQYGDKLSFWGTIGTQTTMPFSTPDEVKRVVTNMIETVGKNGGLVVAPTHTLEPDVSWENIVAFFEAVEEYEYK